MPRSLMAFPSPHSTYVLPFTGARQEEEEETCSRILLEERGNGSRGDLVNFNVNAGVMDAGNLEGQQGQRTQNDPETR